MQTSDDYRSAYCRLLDDADFQALSPEAQRLWFFLRFSRECGPTGLFRWYASLTCARMKITEASLAANLRELTAGGYVRLESGYMLVRNALRFEPTFKPATNGKHLVAVHRHLAALGHLRIAWDLLDGLGLPYPPEWHSIAKPKAIGTLSPTSGSTAPFLSRSVDVDSTIAVAVTVPPATTTTDSQSIPYQASDAARQQEEPEFPPEEGDDLPPNPNPEPVANPTANAYPWDPEDEQHFSHLPGWQTYVEVHMARGAKPPWPRYLFWTTQDLKRRASAAQNPVQAPKPMQEAGDSEPDGYDDLEEGPHATAAT